MTGVRAAGPIRDRAIELATVALHSAQREQWKAAREAVEAIDRECGGDGLVVAIIGWCDTLLARESSATAWGAVHGRPLWKNAETGELTDDADELPAAARWCGELLTARAALDRPAFGTLLESVPKGAVGEYAGALLSSVAATLNALQRHGGSS